MIDLVKDYEKWKWTNGYPFRTDKGTKDYLTEQQTSIDKERIEYAIEMLEKILSIFKFKAYERKNGNTLIELEVLRSCALKSKISELRKQLAELKE